jgi:hypothetical protein
MVTGMMERPDSGITTLFTLGKPNSKAAQAGKDASYASRPIEVEVIGNESSKREQTASVLKLKPYLKPALAAAAVILMGFAMFFSGLSARAVTPEQMYKAIEGAGNIHVVQFTSGETESVQEMWMSRSRGIYIIRTGRELVLRDLTRGIRKRKETANSTPEVETLSADESTKIKQIINGSLGIMPGNDVSQLPPGCKWEEVEEIDLEPEFQDCQVYDLIWNMDNQVLMKWQYFVESASGLPRKVKSYRASSNDKKYEFQMEIHIEYLSDEEINAAIEEASF